ncbi:hypothetical protein Mapa_001329 [Marchantia paleacea]|nr:hypothetical protein Mapa_001329 [Marchantia paleacea]
MLKRGNECPDYTSVRLQASTCRVIPTIITARGGSYVLLWYIAPSDLCLHRQILLGACSLRTVYTSPRSMTDQLTGLLIDRVNYGTE